MSSREKVPEEYLEAVNYFHKNLHPRYLTGFRIRLCSVDKSLFQCDLPFGGKRTILIITFVGTKRRVFPKHMLVLTITKVKDEIPNNQNHAFSNSEATTQRCS